MKKCSLNFWIETMAGGWTLAGIYIGSTTTWGALCYLISLIFWFWMMFRRRMWGMIPLNVSTTFISFLNFWGSL